MQGVEGAKSGAYTRYVSSEQRPVMQRSQDQNRPVAQEIFRSARNVMSEERSVHEVREQ